MSWGAMAPVIASTLPLPSRTTRSERSTLSEKSSSSSGNVESRPARRAAARRPRRSRPRNSRGGGLCGRNALRRLSFRRCADASGDRPCRIRARPGPIKTKRPPVTPTGSRANHTNSACPACIFPEPIPGMPMLRLAADDPVRGSGVSFMPVHRNSRLDNEHPRGKHPGTGPSRRCDVSPSTSERILIGATDCCTRSCQPGSFDIWG